MWINLDAINKITVDASKTQRVLCFSTATSALCPINRTMVMTDYTFDKFKDNMLSHFSCVELSHSGLRDRRDHTFTTSFLLMVKTGDNQETWIPFHSLTSARLDTSQDCAGVRSNTITLEFGDSETASITLDEMASQEPLRVKKLIKGSHLAIIPSIG